MKLQYLWVRAVGTGALLVPIVRSNIYRLLLSSRSRVINSRKISVPLRAEDPTRLIIDPRKRQRTPHLIPYLSCCW